MFSILCLSASLSVIILARSGGKCDTFNAQISILQVLLTCPSQKSLIETLILKWRSHPKHPQPEHRTTNKGLSTPNSLPSPLSIPRYPPTLTQPLLQLEHTTISPMVAMGRRPTPTNRYTSNREFPMVDQARPQLMNEPG